MAVLRRGADDVNPEEKIGEEGCWMGEEKGKDLPRRRREGGEKDVG